MDDTIAAISTALGEGAISIVRLSGEDAISIAMKVYKGKNLLKFQAILFIMATLLMAKK